MYEGWDEAVEEFKYLLLCDIRDERQRNSIEQYMDDERIKRDLSYDNFHENGSYVIEIF